MQEKPKGAIFSEYSVSLFYRFDPQITILN